MSKDKIGKVLRDMGPLMLVALLVPGGTLIAPLIYLLRRRLGSATGRGGRDSPDGVADVVRDDQRAALLDGDADRTPARLAVLHEAGHEIDGLAGGMTVLERDEHDAVAV